MIDDSHQWHRSMPFRVALTKPEMCEPIRIEDSVQLDHALPSLSDQFIMPEPYPEYHAILASLRAKRMNAVEGEQTNTGTAVTKTSPSLPSPASTRGPHTPTDVAMPSRLQEDTLPTTTPHNLIEINTVAKAAQTSQQPFAVDRTAAPAVSNVLANIRPFVRQDSAAVHATQPHVQGSVSAAQLMQDICAQKPMQMCLTGRHVIVSNKYATFADPRGYISVFEYTINGSAILVDANTSYILLTSICKALAHTRDIVALIQSVPDIGRMCRQINGGFLKVQGLWVPYRLAYEVCRRVAWSIRDDLVPLFGLDFPKRCLAPLDPGFGDLRFLSSARRPRRCGDLSITASDALSVAAGSRPHVVPTQSSRPAMTKSTTYAHNAKGSHITPLHLPIIAPAGATVTGVQKDKRITSPNDNRTTHTYERTGQRASVRCATEAGHASALVHQQLLPLPAFGQHRQGLTGALRHDSAARSYGIPGPHGQSKHTLHDQPHRTVSLDARNAARRHHPYYHHPQVHQSYDAALLRSKLASLANRSATSTAP